MLWGTRRPVIFRHSCKCSDLPTFCILTDFSDVGNVFRYTALCFVCGKETVWEMNDDCLHDFVRLQKHVEKIFLSHPLISSLKRALRKQPIP